MLILNVFEFVAFLEWRPISPAAAAAAAGSAAVHGSRIWEHSSAAPGVDMQPTKTGTGINS